MGEHVLTDAEAEGLLAIGVKPRDIVRLGFPDASPGFADFLLWEKTPWPIVSGVHDIADAVARLVTEGPRCDEYIRDGQCRRKVTEWGALRWQHHRALAPTQPGAPRTETANETPLADWELELLGRAKADESEES